jgi:regulator of sigma E protease
LRMQLALSLFAIFLFVCLVLVHEWGHYKAARRAGVDVEEFGLGLPPRIRGKKLKGGMILSLNWLPIGGFVKLKGEHDSSTLKGSFGAATLGNKTKILLAGVTMNLLVGLFLLTVVAWIGTPQLIDNQFDVKSDTHVTHQEVRAGYIQPGSPAETAGLVSRDVIVSLSSDGQTKEVKNAQQLHNATNKLAGQQVTVVFKHGDDVITKQIQLRSTAEVEASKNSDDPKGYLGLVPTDLQVNRATWSAPVVAVGFSGQLVVLTGQGLWHALEGLGSLIAGAVTGNKVARENGQDQATSQVGGPVAIATILWGSGSLGINFVLWIIAIISLTLAIMNVLPIPALDGGRLAMILFSHKVLHKPLSKSAEERITGMGMAVLLILIALITLVDVRRFY